MKRFTLLCLVVLCALISPAQQKRAMTFEDILALNQVSDAQISPDGRWIAYVVNAADMKENAYNSDIWLVPVGGGEAFQLTRSKKADNQPRWSPDGKRIAFLSAREERPQIYVISAAGGEAEKLSDSKTAVSNIAWSPDGGRIAFVAQQEPTPEEEKKQKDKDDTIVVDKNFKFNRISLLDVKTRKAEVLVKGEFSAASPQWSPDGKHIAYTTVPTPRADDGSWSDIWIVEVAGGKTRKLLVNDGPDAAPRWSPDGKWIAFVTGDRSHGSIGDQQMAVMAADGSGAPRMLMPDFLYSSGAAAWSPDGRTIYFSANVRTTSQLFSVPSSGGTPKAISQFAGVMGGPTFSAEARTIAFTHGSVQQPNDVYVATLGGSFAPTKLTDHNPQVRALALGASEVFRWKSKDGMEIEGLLIYPANYEKGKRYPLVACIHGGPSGVWTQSFPGSWGNFGHVWAGNGWAVFYPNVRGSSGYGEKFQLSNIRDWGGGDYQDIQSGLDDLIARGIADPDKLAQTGWSYGGYMTAWTLTQTNRFKAVMVGAGLTNMFSMYSTNDLQSVLDAYFGGEPWQVLENYTRASAMTFIKQARTPTLIQHGQSDTRVPPGQAQELYMGLLRNKVPVELVFFPREPHGLGEPRHQLDKMRREYAWFSKYTLGIEVPPPKAEPAEKKTEQ